MTLIMKRQWLVHSETTPGTIYAVSEYQDESWACDCPDWIFNRTKNTKATGVPYHCKHIRSVITNPPPESVGDHELLLTKNIRFMSNAVTLAKKAAKAGSVDIKMFTDLTFRLSTLQQLCDHYEDRASRWETHAELLRDMLPEDALATIRAAKPIALDNDQLASIVPWLIQQAANENLPTALKQKDVPEKAAGVLELARFYRQEAKRFAVSFNSLQGTMESVSGFVELAKAQTSS